MYANSAGGGRRQILRMRAPEPPGARFTRDFALGLRARSGLTALFTSNGRNHSPSAPGGRWDAQTGRPARRRGTAEPEAVQGVRAQTTG